MKSPACRIASAVASRCTHASGSLRFPRGMWVSEITATVSTAALS